MPSELMLSGLADSPSRAITLWAKLRRGRKNIVKATIFHNPQCGTSRKALALLEERGAHVTVVEFLKTPPSRADLGRIYDRAGMTPLEGLRAKEPQADTLPSITRRSSTALSSRLGAVDVREIEKLFFGELPDQFVNHVRLA